MSRVLPSNLGDRVEYYGQGWRHIPRHPAVDRPGRLGIVGTSINTLHPYGDRVLVGYGNWNTNSGPVDICSFGLDGDWITHASKIDSEAIDLYIDMGEEAVALHADPLGYYTWNKLTPLTRVSDGVRAGNTRIIHSLDGAILPDGGWWVVGSMWEDDSSSKDVAGGIISYDRGATWEHYPFPRTNGNEVFFDRFYVGGVWDGLPYAWGHKTGSAVLRDGVWESLGSERLIEQKSPFQFTDFDHTMFVNVRCSLRHNGREYLGLSDGNILYRPIQ